METARREREATAIAIRCFGGFEVSSGGCLLSDRGWVLEWQLLGFLAAYPPTGAPKERLLDMFWPGKERAAAERCLGSALHRLRRLLQDQPADVPDRVVVCTRHGVCCLDERVVYSDAHEVLTLLRTAGHSPKAVRREMLTRVRRLAGGPLFDGVPWRWPAEAPEVRALTAHVAAPPQSPRGYAGRSRENGERRIVTARGRHLRRTIAPRNFSPDTFPCC